MLPLSNWRLANLLVLPRKHSDALSRPHTHSWQAREDSDEEEDEHGVDKTTHLDKRTETSARLSRSHCVKPHAGAAGLVIVSGGRGDCEGEGRSLLKLWESRQRLDHVTALPTPTQLGSCSRT